MSIQLTNEQQSVLVKVHSQPTPQLAYEEAINGTYAIEATKVLTKYGLILIEGNEAHVTPAGIDKMVEYNLVDSVGTLTDYGNVVKGRVSKNAQTAPPPEEQTPAELPERFDLMQQIAFQAKSR